MMTAAGSAPAGVFVFIKAMLTVFVEAMVPVIIVFVKAALTAFVEAMAPVIILLVKAALMVFVEAMALVTVVFMEAMLTVLFQALAVLFVMVTEGRGRFSVSAVFSGILHIPGTGWIFLFLLQWLMNDRAPGIFRID